MLDLFVLGGGPADQRHIDKPQHISRRLAEPVVEFIYNVKRIVTIFNVGYTPVYPKPRRNIRYIAFRYACIDVQVRGALRRLFGRLALFGTDGLTQKLEIHIISDGLHMAVLLAAQYIAGPADFKIPHCNFKARTELGKLPYGRQPLFGDIA